MKLPTELEPTGTCWCGCGEATPVDSHFLRGHDKRAVAIIITSNYGSTAGFLLAHGYGPNGKSTAAEYENKQYIEYAELNKWKKMKNKK